MNTLIKSLRKQTIHCPRGKRHVGNTYCHDCDREDEGFAVYGRYQLITGTLTAIIKEMEKEYEEDPYSGGYAAALQNWVDKLQETKEGLISLKY